ncbi:MAG: ABC transporter substrate-binding protein [Thermoleophilia bacterium]|nr:ABC transporter substrate-binding protein [Thermoleophilia bacterium]
MHTLAWRTAVSLAAAALLGAVLTAAAAAAPAHRAAKTIVFCSDTTYPPMESLQGGKPVGADIDIANAVAALLHAKAQIKTTGFDVIIPALLKKKCDAIISAMTDTAERRKQVDFADYITVGMLLMVKKGNPEHITGLASLSGKSVAVESATTEKATLDATNKRFAKQGKKPITIKIYPADTNAAAALLAGKVDAYFADATPVLYYIKKTGGKFETAGGQIQAAPEGIATRKGDPLGKQFKQAIAKLYANGTMQKILAKWGISAFALKK